MEFPSAYNLTGGGRDPSAYNLRIDPSEDCCRQSSGRSVTLTCLCLGTLLVV